MDVSSNLTPTYRRWFGMALALIAIGAIAQTPLAPDIETSATLGNLVQQLQAQDAQPSSHVLLDTPDISLPGSVRIALKSELPGTRLMVLARGKFVPSASPSARMGGPMPITRRTIGEYTPVDRLPRPVWLASLSFMAGESPLGSVTIELTQTQFLTLFVHAQGRWWFVTREVKIGHEPVAKRLGP